MFKQHDRTGVCAYCLLYLENYGWHFRGRPRDTVCARCAAERIVEKKGMIHNADYDIELQYWISWFRISARLNR